MGRIHVVIYRDDRYARAVSMILHEMLRILSGHDIVLKNNVRTGAAIAVEYPFTITAMCLDFDTAALCAGWPTRIAVLADQLGKRRIVLPNAYPYREMGIGREVARNMRLAALSELTPHIEKRVRRSLKKRHLI